MPLLLGSLLLNSCYFNSAGMLFDKASYRAAVEASDLKPGDVVYVRGNEYYIELPRYRFGPPVKLQMDAFDQEQGALSSKQRIGGHAVDMFLIPEAYAKYLMGETTTAVEPEFFMRVEDADTIKATASAQKTVNTVPPTFEHHYKYTSSSAAWLYTAGVFDWLCVDLPVTCIENSLVLCGGVLVLLLGSSDSADPSAVPDGSFQRQDITTHHYRVTYE